MNGERARYFIAVDIGSNATKIKTWSLDGRAPVPIDFQRHPMRLGESAFQSGEISAEISDRLINLLNTLPKNPDIIIQAVATSAMRDAINGEAIRRRILKQTGVEIHILSGEQEARLMALGALGASTPPGQASVLIDIGGGSTEIIVTRGAKIIIAHSMRLGAVRLRGRCYPAADPPSADQLRVAEAEVDHALDAELRGLSLPAIDRAIGLAGTITTLHKMIRHENPSFAADRPIPLRMILTLQSRLTPMTFDEIVAQFPIEPDRAEVILPGAQILTSVLPRLHLNELDVAYQGVSDGLLQLYLTHG